MRIEAVPSLWIVRPIDAIGVELTRRDISHPGMPHITSAMPWRCEGDHTAGFGIARTLEEQEPDACGMTAEERKVRAVPTLSHTER